MHIMDRKNSNTNSSCFRVLSGPRSWCARCAWETTQTILMRLLHVTAVVCPSTKAVMASVTLCPFPAPCRPAPLSLGSVMHVRQGWWTLPVNCVLILVSVKPGFALIS